MSPRGGGFFGLGDVLQSVQERARPDFITARVGVILAAVRSEPMQWLWPGRIPLGKITVLDGDPGLGKSMLTLDLAARITRGLPMPGCEAAMAGGVVLVSAEDDPADTLRPRLEACGADLERILCLSTIPVGSSERLVEFPTDVELLAQAIRQVEGKLAVIDPLPAFLGPEVNAHRDQDVRRALAPLAKMAAREKVAILVIRHWNKGQGGNPLYRGGGSIGIIGAARAGLMVAAHPEDPETRVLAVTKSNLGKAAQSLSFRVISVEPNTARVEWLGASEFSADGLMALRPTPEQRLAVDEAMVVLREILSAGPLAANEAQGQAEQAGIHPRTLDRAKRRLGVVSRRDKYGPGAQWTWSLGEGPVARRSPRRAPTKPIERQGQELAPFGEVGALRGPAALAPGDAGATDEGQR